MEFVGMPAVQILLVAIIVLSLLVEIKTGGMGLGALLGIVAAGIFFGGMYVKGLVSFYHIALFLAGILCIVIEILTPGAGLFAGIGIAAMFYSLILALGGDIGALYMLLLSVLLSGLVFAILIKRLPSSRMWKKIVLSDMTSNRQGYVTAADKRMLIGCTGMVLTELRPAGTALLGETPVDVVSEGMFIKKGETVRVIAVNGSRVVVRRSE
jgi:Membrane-bound serine protease (ClpP class)